MSQWIDEGINVAAIRPQEPGNTEVSGVIDREDYHRFRWFEAVCAAGAGGAASVFSGLVLQMYHSDTVSATASGMDAISGAGVSGLTASGQTMAIIGDARYLKRFIGFTLSVPTTSAFISVNFRGGTYAVVSKYGGAAISPTERRR